MLLCAGPATEVSCSLTGACSSQRPGLCDREARQRTQYVHEYIDVHVHEYTAVQHALGRHGRPKQICIAQPVQMCVCVCVCVCTQQTPPHLRHHHTDKYNRTHAVMAKSEAVYCE